MDTSSYQALFISSAKKLAAAILDTLEKEKLTQADLELLHRSAHSLSGESSAMNQKEIREISKKLQDLFSGVLKGKTSVENLNRADLLQQVNKLSSLIEQLKTDKLI